ncbi:hypothetical protein MNBD_GAMMA22-1967 [hydrothermal vent metagenome]|uniref:Uncharacterized protein n=1 Tax=hydrothermal vent metagenome TaxID=652676 RepID=A0A3B1B8U5_9ZZZZ
MFLSHSQILFLIQIFLCSIFVYADEITSLKSDTQTDSTLNDSRTANMEALELLENIFSLEESLLQPENDQLVVLMKQELGAQLLLSKIKLYIDTKLVQTYHYKNNDLEKLMNRGVLRLVTVLMTPGMHTIDIELYSLSHSPIKQKLKFKKDLHPMFVSLGLVGTKIKLDQWKVH